MLKCCKIQSRVRTLSNVCQPLLKMLVLWGNEQNGPIWTFNGATEGQRIATFFFASFYELDAAHCEFAVQGTKYLIRFPD